MEPRIYSQQLRPMPIGIQHQKVNRQAQHPEHFNQILQSEINRSKKIKISKHAEKRLEDRGISISEEKWNLIQTKLQEATTKGIKDSLVVLHNAALVVNAPSNTVITALDRNEASSQIFTNINGTILIDE